MKQIAILFLSIFIITATSCKKDEEDADFVNQSAETKTALLEEFTGVKCGYCPDGAAVAAQMIADHPGQVIAIGIHGGSYSSPYPGDPDLSSSWAQELISFSNLSGYPAGMVQRRDHDSDGKIATGRGGWPGIASSVITESTPVNIGIKTEYDTDNNQVKIKVQVYYTADGGGENLLNVAITENGIQTKQSGDPTPNDPYTHKHVLRDLITGQWGESFTETTSGTLKTFEYTYTPSGVVASNCEVVAFITKADKTEVLNADMCDLVDDQVE